MFFVRPERTKLILTFHLLQVEYTTFAQTTCAREQISVDYFKQSFPHFCLQPFPLQNILYFIFRLLNHLQISSPSSYQFQHPSSLRADSISIRCRWSSTWYALTLKSEIIWCSSYFCKETLHYCRQFNRFTIENAAFYRECALNMTLFGSKEWL